MSGDFARWVAAELEAAARAEAVQQAQNATCPGCWHVMRLHAGSDGCQAKTYPAHSLTGEPCPCDRTTAPAPYADRWRVSDEAGE